MPTIITRENAKQHCRTCMSELGGKIMTAPQGSSTTLQECKFISISLENNTELLQLIEKYIDDKVTENMHNFPQNLCLSCFNQLQTFEKFRRRAQENALILHELLTNNAVHKVEIENEIFDGGNRSANSNDIYKMLVKDTLMETESVIIEAPQLTTLTNVDLQIADPFTPTTTATKTTITPTTKLIKTDDEEFIIEEECAGWEDETEIIEYCESEEGSESGMQDFKSDSQNEYSSIEIYDENDNDNENETIYHLEEVEAENTLDEYKSGDIGELVEIDYKQNKKRRRTKREMEEWRASQEDLSNSPSKRRHKGSKNTFRCNQCNHNFAHKITLDAHVRKVHEGSKRPFQCDRCDKSYTFIGGLYTHIKEIHEAEVRSYACDQPGCDRVYTSYIAMQKHKRVKHSEIPYQKKYVCEQCGATFNQSGNLKYHRRSKHPTESDIAELEKTKERFECTICKKLFHSRYTLKYHTLQLHTKDTKYECGVCGRRLAKKFMLVQHMLIHSTDKLPCEQCGRQFIRKFELEAHIRAVHLKLKPFECQYCTESFASRKTLRHHEYIHTGEKPYVCDICGQAFRQQTCLKNHRKSHAKNQIEQLSPSSSTTILTTYIEPMDGSAEDTENY